MERETPITINDIGDLMAELRSVAINLLANESNASLRPSDLVQTGLRRYKVSDQDWQDITWENRAHFFKSASMMMRRALIDHARKRQVRPTLDGKEQEALDYYNIPAVLEHTPDRIVALDEALGWMEVYDSELAKIVQYHYYFGLTVKELSELLDIAERTVKRRLDAARILLKKKMEEIGI